MAITFTSTSPTVLPGDLVMAVDLSFSKGDTCRNGVWANREEFQRSKGVSFSEALQIVEKAIGICRRIHLVLEGPLSYAFDQIGNPMPRQFRDPHTSREVPERGQKAWYLPIGASVAFAAQRFLSCLAITKNESDCSINIVEGLDTTRLPFTIYNTKERFEFIEPGEKGDLCAR